jgi:hypothetical protein
MEKGDEGGEQLWHLAAWICWVTGSRVAHWPPGRLASGLDRANPSPSYAHQRAPKRQPSWEQTPQSCHAARFIDSSRIRTRILQPMLNTKDDYSFAISWAIAVFYQNHHGPLLPFSPYTIHCNPTEKASLSQSLISRIIDVHFAQASNLIKQHPHGALSLNKTDEPKASKVFGSSLALSSLWTIQDSRVPEPGSRAEIHTLLSCI